MRRIAGLAALLSASAVTSVATSEPDETAYDRALRIARALNDHRLVLKLTGPRADLPGCSEAELHGIVGSHEALGEPEGGVAVYRRRIAKFPSELGPRLGLAMLLDRMGKSKDAIPVWAEIEERFGLTPAQAATYAVVLDRHGRGADALALMKRTAKKATPADATFWEVFGPLAWERDDAIALQVYRTLWKAGSKEASVAPRLMFLTKRAGALDEAIDVALVAFDRDLVPSHFFFAAAIRREREEWVALRAIVARGEAKSHLLAPFEEWWVLRGDVHGHFGDKSIARASYRKALERNAASVPARAALLWDAIERDDVPELKKLLFAWRADAALEPAYFGPFAVGLDRIGRSKEALPFFERQWQLAPRDYLWGLEYADALERVGRHDEALAARRRTFKSLRKDVLAGKHEPALEETHALLARRFLGAPEGEKWLMRLLGRDPTSLEKREVAVGWFLADSRLDRARRVLAISHAKRIDRPEWKKHRLAVAIADGDRETVGSIMSNPKGLSPKEIREGAEALEREDRRDGLASDPTESGDTAAVATRARDLRDRHAPHLIAEGRLLRVDLVQALGPAAIAAFDGPGGYRLLVDASALQLSLLPGRFSTTPRLDAPETELQAIGMARRYDLRGMSELALGVNHRGLAAPRGWFRDVRALGSGLDTALTVSLNDVIDDVPFLRVAALRHRVQVAAQQDLAAGFFLYGEAAAMEDHGRKYGTVGAEAGGLGAIGYRILSRVPEWTVSARGMWYERWNRDRVPSEMQSYLPLGMLPDELSGLLPPSRFQLVSLAMQIARGDFVERHRTDDTSFPRYDCDGAVGWLVSQPSVAAHVKCTVMTRVARSAYLGLMAFHALGVAGRRSSTMSQASLSFTWVL